MRAALARLQKCSYSSSTATTASGLLALLRRNPELGGDDAATELRWMRDAARQQSTGEAGLRAMVERRAKGEPLQYILGDTDFGPLTLLTRAPVLIPRPDTAHVIEHLASLLPSSRSLRVLDLCTGSGCIPLLLAHLLPNVTAVGVDISGHAVSLARDNIAHVGLGDRVRVLNADILSSSFSKLMVEEVGKVDVITANPPYIPRREWEALPASVKEFEDPGALLAGLPAVQGGEEWGEEYDGTAFYAHIGKIARSLLKEGSEGVKIAVEIGAGQGKTVPRLLPGKTKVVQDQYGRDRMVVATF